MQSGLFGLDRKQKTYMTLTQLSPTIISTTALIITKDALLTLLSIQIIGYILVPYLYIQLISKEKELNVYFMNEFQDRFNQIRQGISLFASAFGLIFFAYFILYEFKQSFLLMIDIPIKYNAIYLMCFSFLFGIVNPILEEWFWRIFIQKTCQNSEGNKWVFNVNYALFHFFILTFVMDWKLAIGFTSNFFSIGRSFDYIKDKYGILTGIITHIGMSLASVLVMFDILYLEWGHKQNK